VEFEPHHAKNRQLLVCVAKCFQYRHVLLPGE